MELIFIFAVAYVVYKLSKTYFTLSKKAEEERHLEQSRLKAKPPAPKIERKPAPLVQAEAIMPPVGIPANPKQTRAVFLNWINGRIYPIEDYPQYFAFKYGIADFESYFKTAIIEGYVRIEIRQKELGDLKITELKDILRTASLPVSGTKPALVERITVSVPAADYAERLRQEQAVNLTELGRRFLADNQIYVDLHRYSGMPLDANRYTPGQSFAEFADAELSADVQAQIEAGQWGLVRSSLFSLYNVHKGQGRDDQAIYYLLATFLIDLSGLEGMDAYKVGLGFDPDLAFMFAPGIISRIKALSHEITQPVLDKICALPLPLNACPSAIFINIIREITTGTLREDYWRKQLHLRAKSLLKNLK